MLKQSDVQGRLRLFRYGLVVIVVVTFLISLLAPWAAFQGLPTDVRPAITEFLDEAAIYTIVVAVVMVIAYFAYAQFLKATSGGSGSAS